MSNKIPQPSAVLVQRLRRVARALDGLAGGDTHARDTEAWRAFANTCWQAAARLDDLSGVVSDSDIEDAVSRR